MKKDERGCPICQCNEQPVPDSPGSSPARGQGGRGGGHRTRGSHLDRGSRTRCLAPICMMFCPNGFKTDSNGCAICSCQDPPTASQQPAAAVANQPAAPTDVVSCRRSRCRNHCAFGYHVNAVGCQTCVCKSEPDAAPDARTGTRPELCSLPKLTGQCRAALTRWHFSPTSGRCETFTYGGCRGNANNFRSEDECKAACLVE